MKVLWFTNIPMPQMLGSANHAHAASGGWMVSLLEKLANYPDLDISVVCVSPGLKEKTIHIGRNVHLTTISQGPARRLFGYSNLDNNPRYLDLCAKIANEIHPDVIHIHGSERFYGLLGARKLVSVPVIISLQGLLHEYSKFRYYFGVTSLKNIFRLHDPFHLVRGMGPIPSFFQLQYSAKREIEILKGNHWFIGRTDWDHSHLRMINPNAHYFDIPEMLRPTFYANEWAIKAIKRNRIIFTNANTHSRGAEILIDAVAILKRDFPEIRLALAGGVEKQPYGKLIQQQIIALGLKSNIEYLGTLNEIQMTRELLNAHVFVIPSLLENSPNSLCEAQLVGMPCVASYTGGIPSLIDDRQTGVFFPAGDAAVLAARIQDIFSDDKFACAIGQRSREVSLVRHDPDRITQKIIDLYHTVY